MSVAFRELEATIDSAIAEIGPSAILSFDVFDTLVHRRCSREFVKDHVARQLETELKRLRIRATASVLEARLAAEQALFDAARSAGGDPEFHIRRRSSMWVDLLVPDQVAPEQRRRLAEFVEAVEVNAERGVLSPNPVMPAVVERLRRRVDRLVFTSDMYLGAENVASLLGSCGYGGLFDAGYVSGDLAAYKQTGRLFERLLEAESAVPGQVLHIGDDLGADRDGPRSVGIRSVWIDDAALRARRVIEAQDHAAVRADRAAAPLVVDRFVRDGLPAPRSFAESYGRSLFGPVFANFVHQVATSADALGLSALFFLSRDGFVFQRIYDAMTERDDTPISRLPSRYICLSRLPVLRAMLQDGISLKAIISAKNHLVLRSRNVGNVFNSLGLDPHMVASLAKRHGVDPDGFFHDGLLHWPPFLNLLNDRELTREARRVGQEAANLVRDYLRQEGLFDFRRIGLVDIGWGATIQDQLRDCIADEPDCPTMVGYYFGGNQSLYDRRTPDNWMEPIFASVFSPDAELTLGNAASFSFVGLLEEAARAPHGTCVGYVRRNVAVDPAIRPDQSRRSELVAEPALSRLQVGAADYAREYARAAHILGLDAYTLRGLANTAIQRMVFYPQPAEVRFWQDVHHTNDVGGIFEIDEVLVAPPISRWRRWWRWREVSRASMWTFGSVRYLLGAMGLVLYNLGWSASKSKNVQGPMNALRFSAPYYWSDESRCFPDREPGKLEQSSIYQQAVARADAHVRDHVEAAPAVVDLVDPVAATGSVLVLKANRIAPKKWYGGMRVVNDGVPAALLFDRAVLQPVRSSTGRARSKVQSLTSVLRSTFQRRR